MQPLEPLRFLQAESRKKILERAQNGEIDAVALRLATVFGYAPGIRFHTMLNKFVFMASTGMPLIIYGTGEQKRPFLHVKDASRALLFCMEREDMKNDVFNVVGCNSSVNEIVQCIKKKCPHIETVNVNTGILNQISYAVNSAKIQNRGFTAETTIDKGLMNLWCGLGLSKSVVLRTVNSSKYHKSKYD